MIELFPKRLALLEAAIKSANLEPPTEYAHRRLREACIKAIQPDGTVTPEVASLVLRQVPAGLIPAEFYAAVWKVLRGTFTRPNNDPLH